MTLYVVHVKHMEKGVVTTMTLYVVHVKHMEKVRRYNNDPVCSTCETHGEGASLQQ
jgi:hypothetical protein